jgi:hypothetical protein
MSFNADIECPFCEWSGLLVDLDSGDVIVEKPCQHLVYVYGYVPDSCGWRHDALDGDEVVDEYIFERALGVPADDPIRPLVEARDAQADGYGGADDNREDPLRWNVNALFSIDPVTYVRQVAECCREDRPSP